LALAVAATAAHGASPFGSRRPAPEPAVAPTRDYEAADLLQAQRAAIATLQDLGFVIESADAAQGVITASRLDRYPLRLTVSIAAKGDAAISASVSADYAGAPVASAAPAEAFFAAYAVALSPPVDF
jgi:hypothetical protein